MLKTIKKKHISNSPKSINLSQVTDFIFLDTTTIIENSKPNHTFFNKGIIFGMCSDGNAITSINFKEYNINKNTILVIPPHSIVETIELSNNFTINALYFSFDTIVELNVIKDYDNITKIAQLPCVEIDENDFNDLIEFYNFIVKQYNSIDIIYKKTMSNFLINAINLKIRSIYKSDKIKLEKSVPTRHNLITTNFFKLLFNNYKENRSISFYADKLCLSQKYLSSIIKKSTGYPMLFWTNNILVIYAKCKLKSTSLTITQISDELNFPNPSIFGRFFKQHTGMTPLSYRKAK